MANIIVGGQNSNNYKMTDIHQNTHTDIYFNQVHSNQAEEWRKNVYFLMTYLIFLALSLLDLLSLDNVMERKTNI